MVELSLKTVAQIQAAYFFAAAAVYYFLPEFGQETFGHLAGVDLSSTGGHIMMMLNLTLYVSLGLLWVGVSQFPSEGSVKKAMQYGMSTYLLCLFVLVWKGLGYLPQKVFWVKFSCLASGLLLLVVAVYMWGKKVRYSTGKSNLTYTKALRLEYGQLLVWGITFLGCPWVADEGLLPGLPKGPATEYFFCMRGALLTGMAIMYMGIVQCDEDSQRIGMQWGTIRRGIRLFYVISLCAPSILSGENGLEKVYGMIAYESINIIHLVHSIYPCSTREWVLRISAVAYGYMGFLSLFYPALSAVIFQCPSLDSPFAHLAGCYQLMLAVIFAAGTECDYDEAQKKMLQYSCAGHLGMLAMQQYMGIEYGCMVYVAFILTLVIVGDLYHKEVCALKLPDVIAALSPKKSPTSSTAISLSKMKRGRSKTPARK